MSPPLRPETLRGDLGALPESFEPRPRDVLVDAATETAVRAGDHVLATHELREVLDAVGNQLRVLDDVRCMTNDTRDDDLALGELHVLPDLPLVLMAGVRALEAERLRVDLEHEVDDVLELDIGRVRAVPGAPADVDANLLLRDALERMVDSVDADLGEVAVVLDRRLGNDLVPVLGDGRIVDLDDEPGVGDRLVLLAQRIGTRVYELFLGLVILVADTGGGSRRNGGDEALVEAVLLHRGLHVLHVGLDLLLTDVGHRAGRHREGVGGGVAKRDAGGRVLVGSGELRPVAAVREVGEPDVARGGLDVLGDGVDIVALELEAAEALERIRPPCAVVDLAGHSLAVFTIVRDGDANVLLLANDGRDRLGEDLVEPLE